MQIFVGLFLGNVCAVAANAFTWHLRRKYLWQMIGFGFGSFILFINFVCVTWADMKFLAQGDTWVYYHVWSKLSNPYGYISLNIIFLSVFSGVAWLQARQIPTQWWKAFLALWAEICLCEMSIMISGFVLTSLLSSAYVYETFTLAFTVTEAVLTFLRPLCLRWACPTWQVLNDLRVRKA
jgi:hypothetical protein